VKFEEERYVRVYTRDTGDWLMLSFEAQSVWLMMLRKFDRSGLIHLGRGGRRMLAAVLGHPAQQELVDRALDELLADGCVTIVTDGTKLYAPNFIDAQDWTATDADRARKYRAKKAKPPETLESENPENLSTVTNVTTVTQPSPRAVPCRSVPSVPSVGTDVRADASAPAAGDGPPPEDFRLTCPSQGKKRRQTPQQLLKANLDSWREAHLGEGCLPDQDLSAAWVNKKLKPLADVEPEVLGEAYWLFLGDEYAAARDPPYPIRLFVSQWSRWVSQAARERSVANG
jgi:hypothetical protein